MCSKVNLASGWRLTLDFLSQHDPAGHGRVIVMDEGGFVIAPSVDNEWLRIDDRSTFCGRWLRSSRHRPDAFAAGNNSHPRSRARVLWKSSDSQKQYARSLSTIFVKKAIHALQRRQGAKKGKAPRQRWHSWHSWQSGLCNLQNLKDARETESLSLRQL
jgi:hypothetical protein